MIVPLDIMYHWDILDMDFWTLLIKMTAVGNIKQLLAKILIV